MAKFEITEVRVRPYNAKGSSLKGFATVTISDCLVLTGLKIVDGEKELFVGMPATKGEDKDGNEKYYDIFYPITKEFREEITNAVLEEYFSVLDDDDKKKKSRKK